MLGRIVTFDNGKHSLQLYVMGGWAWEGAADGTRREWETAEAARKYAEENGVERLEEKALEI